MNIFGRIHAKNILILFRYRSFKRITQKLIYCRSFSNYYNRYKVWIKEDTKCQQTKQPATKL